MPDELDDFVETRVLAQQFMQAIGLGYGGVNLLTEARNTLVPLMQEINADPDIPQNVKDAAQAKIVTLRQAAEDAIN